LPRHAFSVFNPPSTTATSTLSLHDALPISLSRCVMLARSEFTRLSETLINACPSERISPDSPNADGLMTHSPPAPRNVILIGVRSEEHTSELQSRENLVCRLLLEKKNKTQQ